MRAVIQRVNWAKVRVGSQVVGQIERGLLLFLGVEVDDTEADLNYLVSKCSGVRIFNDDEGKMNLPPHPDSEAFLVISQFTLCGDLRKGKRPSWNRAADAEEARAFYQEFVNRLKAMGWRVETGRFQADMKIESENSGPVTLLLDSKKTF